jgi:hypothetical protein
MSGAPSWIVIVISLSAVHFAMREAVFERARITKDQISFPPVFSLRAMFWLGIPAFAYAGCKVVGEIRSPKDWSYPAISIGLILLCFFSVPGTISLDNEGISIKKYLRLRGKRVLWHEVSSVTNASALKTITIYDRDGATSIAHSQFHVDPVRFLLELQKHVKKDAILYGSPVFNQKPWW